MRDDSVEGRVAFYRERKDILGEGVERERNLAKMTRHGVIHNVSTYPLPTFRPHHADRNSKALTFDINFEFYDDNGERYRVWFYRGFRLPPPLKDGDRVEIAGRFGQMFGLISKNIFYASRIVDRKRGRIYTGFRNKRIKSTDEPSPQGEVA